MVVGKGKGRLLQELACLDKLRLLFEVCESIEEVFSGPGLYFFLELIDDFRLFLWAPFFLLCLLDPLSLDFVDFLLSLLQLLRSIMLARLSKSNFPHI